MSCCQRLRAPELSHPSCIYFPGTHTVTFILDVVVDGWLKIECFIICWMQRNSQCCAISVLAVPFRNHSFSRRFWCSPLDVKQSLGLLLPQAMASSISDGAIGCVHIRWNIIDQKRPSVPEPVCDLLPLTQGLLNFSSLFVDEMGHCQFLTMTLATLIIVTCGLSWS